MENIDNQTAVTSVAPKGLDEVEHKAHPTGANAKPLDAASSKGVEEAGGHEDAGATKEGLPQEKDNIEVQSGVQDAAPSESKASGSGTTSATQSYVPPVKRFSAVNINKKFLQKNQSSTATATGTPSGSAGSKQAGVIARPSPQTAHSHSRLVTAKLTATPLPSSAGQGWSRPNSVTPPSASPANANGPAKGSIPAIAPVGGHGLPHIAPGGKIIQPQMLKQKLDGPGRPAWRNIQPGAIGSGAQVQNEFPTAAEAAQSRLMKLADMKAAADVSDAQKQAMSETADAFRGVHLDPNAHHWDEMEEDDNDDFLGGVIEFGDGRQYTIQVSDGTKVDPNVLVDATGNSNAEGQVSKSERFVDDFDRSWPKSRQERGAHVFHDGHGTNRDEPSLQRRGSQSETSSVLSGHSPVSMRDPAQSRVLFNERLNRMEPIPSNKHIIAAQAPAHGAPHHRESPDVSSRFHNNRLERDAPPHGNLASSRKSHDPWGTSLGPEQHAREIREMKSERPTSSVHGEQIERRGRHDFPSSTSIHSGPPSNGRPSGSRESSVSHSIANGAPPSVASSDDRTNRRLSFNRDQHRPHHLQSGHAKDIDRQPPPHIKPMDKPSAAVLDHYPCMTPGALDSDDSTQKFADRNEQDHLADYPSQTQTQEHAEMVAPQAAPTVPPDDVEKLRKAFLADSAERAKKRRQQEEEERLKAQERARKKAAELEARIAGTKASEASKHTVRTNPSSVAQVRDSTVTDQGSVNKPTEADVLSVIEDAVNSVSSVNTRPSKAAEHSGKDDQVSRSPFAKTFPHKGGDHPALSSESQESGQSRKPPAMADRADSWRAKAKPPVLPVQNSKNDISHDPSMSTLPTVRAFELQADDSMEVIDFSDMGRLVGEKTSQRPVSDLVSGSGRPARAVASDFFTGVAAEKTELDSWRKPIAYSNKSYSAVAEDGPGQLSHKETSSGSSESKMVHMDSEDIGGSLMHKHAHSKAPLSPTNGFSSQTTPNHSGHPPASPGIPRFLRSPNSSYREAPLSALDDTMSRIRGALDGMHSTAEPGSKEERKEAGSSPDESATASQPAPISGPSRPNKWLPPALRPQGLEPTHKHTESFEFTRPEPPRSPAPSDSTFTIRLPAVSRRVEPLTKKQMNFHKYSSGPVRWEILSFDPPVEGMTKKSLSVNDVLFRKPQGLLKSKRYKVSLPKSGSSGHPLPVNGSQTVDKGNLPNGSRARDHSNGTSGRSRMDEQGSWRSFTNAQVEAAQTSENVMPELDVTSRSPPPELPSVVKYESTQIIFGTTNVSKPSQKLLDGSDVAFYRDLRKQADGQRVLSTVSFTVGSEIEGPLDGLPGQKASTPSADISKPPPNGLDTVSDARTAPATRQDSLSNSSIKTGNATSSTSTPAAKTQPLTQDIRTLEHQNEPFLQKQPVTPPPQNTPSNWGRSPSRAPDPEHLKAVWSQASNNESIPAVNSLKGIADDLTAVPFTLHEVKSEGGTPPPSGPVVPPTRMSASEVTRAFQTVPSGPSNAMTPNSMRGHQLPSNMGSPIGSQRALKPPVLGLPPQPSVNPNAPRPPYMSYPTSMNSHSPSPPTLVYSHVMPNGMAPSPAGSPYGQPVWMPLQVQQAPQMIRAQPPSPYSPSLMPYHMPGAQNGVYPPSNGMPNPQGSPATYPSAPPSQMMVSPVLPHASPAPPHMMYQGSPMLVHIPPPGGTPQPRAYPPGAVGMGRGMPVQNPMDPRSHPSSGPPSAPAQRYPVHNPGYTPVPSQSFRQW